MKHYISFACIFFYSIVSLAQATQTRNDAGLRGDSGASSGYFETNNPINYPTSTPEWWHLLDVRHSNPSNNFAMQFAAKFYEQGLWYRSTNDNASQPWSKVVVETNGNVGIGTVMPNTKLHVHQSAADQIGLIVQGNTINTDLADHYIGITLDGDYGNGLGNYSQIRSYSNLYRAWGSKLAFYTSSSHQANTLAERMRIDDSGNVGIGTTTPNEMLSVNGKIRAKEVKVETANWPDYVFEDTYKPKTLAEIESFIKVYKHLPEIPSAKELEQNGVALGEMNKILLKKVEELTLHLIEKDKELKKVNENNKLQDARISALEKLIKN